MSKKLSIILSICIIISGLFNANIAYASDVSNDSVISTLLDVKEYDEPISIKKNTQKESNSVIISGKEAKLLSDKELTNKLKEKTNLNQEEIEDMVIQIKSVNNTDILKEANSLNVTSSDPIYLATYHEYSWVVQPYISKTETWVNYATSWIGIDAYRSSVGLVKGTTEQKSVTKTFTFTGSLEIKKFKPSLSYTTTETQTTIITESATAPAWHTVNWRPYIAFYRDFYAGTQNDTLYGVLAYTGDVVVIYSNNNAHSGTYDRYLVKTTELWSRENTSRNENASTPLPPSGPPSVG